MAEDHDLVRFLLGEMGDDELERLHDRLENHPDKQAELKDLQAALTALGELRADRHAKTTSPPWLPRAAAILLAFFAGVVANHWFAAATQPASGGSYRKFYDSYAAQPSDRGSLSRAMIALAKLRSQR